MSLESLNGLRALLNLWIMIFHAAFQVTSFLTKEASDAMFSHPLSHLVKHGYVAVDAFFLLSGFLMGRDLLNKPLSLTTLHTYWRTRAVRIMLPIFGLILLHCGIVNRTGSFQQSLVRQEGAVKVYAEFFPGAEKISSGCDMAWGVVAHVSPLLPYNGCFMHSWSVDVQYLSYLLLPLLLLAMGVGAGKGKGAAAGAGAGEKEGNSGSGSGTQEGSSSSSITRKLMLLTLVWGLSSSLFRFFCQRYLVQFPEGTLLSGVLDLFFYSHPLNRMWTIMAGVALARGMSDRQSAIYAFLSRASRSAVLQLLCWTMTLGWFAVMILWKDIAGDHRFVSSPLQSLYVSLLGLGGPASVFAWSWVMASAVHRIGVFADLPVLAAEKEGKEGKEKEEEKEKEEGGALYPAIASGQGLPGLHLSSLLCLRPLPYLAELSYWAYLLHPMVFNGLFSNPFFFYPPSPRDLAPRALLQEWALPLDVEGMQSFLWAGNSSSPALHAVMSAVAAAAAPVLAAVAPAINSCLIYWAAMREEVLPSGQGFSMRALLVEGCMGIAVTYALCHFMMLCFELPLRRLLTGGGERRKALVHRCSIVYNWAVLLLTLASAAALTYAILAWVTPDMEELLLKNFAPGSEVAKAAAKAAAEAAAQAVAGVAGGLPSADSVGAEQNLLLKEGNVQLLLE